MRVGLPSSFQDIRPKVRKRAQNTRFITFYLDIWAKNGHFKDQYLEKSSENIPSNFYPDLNSPKIIQKWIYSPLKGSLGDLHMEYILEFFCKK